MGMILARFTTPNGETKSKFYDGRRAWWNYYADTFSPDTVIHEVIELSPVHGVDYQDKKNNVRRLFWAVNNFNTEGLTEQLENYIFCYISNLARRFGLLQELRNDGAEI